MPLNAYEQEYDPLAMVAANNANVNGPFYTALINQESGANPTAINGDAVGIAQIMPETAVSLGLNLANRLNPQLSLDAGAALIAQNLSQCNGEYICAGIKYGTFGKNATVQSVENDPNLTPGQQALLQQAYNADELTSPGTVASAIASGALNMPGQVSGAGSASKLASSGGTCGEFDVVCLAKQNGADLLGIVVGVVLAWIALSAMTKRQSITTSIKGVATSALKTGRDLALAAS